MAPGYGHGHEHGHQKLELPDYKQWKIEGTPLETREAGCKRAQGFMGLQMKLRDKRVVLHTMFPLLVHY